VILLLVYGHRRRPHIFLGDSALDSGSETIGSMICDKLRNGEGGSMARPLRIEFGGALYHVTSRGDRQENIYEADIKMCDV